jgi:hypothetical protein
VMVARQLPSARAAAPDLVALTVAVVAPLTMSPVDRRVWGILQRLIFLAAASWYGREAWLASRRNDIAPTAQGARR